MRWLHETTGEERIVRTRDPVFAQTRDFLAMHVVQANADIAGGHVSSINAAFALMGLAHILQAGKQSQQEGLPSNLATSLQVQMYLGEAMAVAGVAKDVVQVVQLAREGMREAAEVSSALGQTVRIEARLLRTLGTTLDVVGGLASVGLVGVDIYNLANAKTDMQRAVAGCPAGRGQHVGGRNRRCDRRGDGGRGHRLVDHRCVRGAAGGDRDRCRRPGRGLHGGGGRRGCVGGEVR
jgi:hypothetical protein